ncbi:MAG: hypothetical protein JOZ53_11275 [Planctomycetaceae bacterium]|nr:hypothetical protein [Planctomycetaceae bacterium]
MLAIVSRGFQYAAFALGQHVQELDLESRICPPGKEPDVHPAACPLGVAAEEPDHFIGRPEQIPEPRRPQEDLPVIEVIESPSPLEGWKSEEDRQQRRESGEIPMPQQGTDRRGEPFARVWPRWDVLSVHGRLFPE